MFRKLTAIPIVIVLLAMVFASPSVASATGGSPPACGDETYEASNSFNNGLVAITFESSDQQVDITGLNGWAVTGSWYKTWFLDSWHYIGAGNQSNYNPSGSSDIYKIKVTVHKDCAQHVPVTMCHATPPDTAENGWNQITVDDDAVLSQGHGTEHDADIIPAFDSPYVPGGHYDGKNLSTLFGWGATGQQVLDNDCVIPPQPHQYSARAVGYGACGEGNETPEDPYDNPNWPVHYGWWVDVYIMDFGVTIPDGYHGQYEGGYWGSVYVLESNPAHTLDITLPDGTVTTLSVEEIDEPERCQKTHQVSWDRGSGCQGYNTFYWIDEGPHVIYATGAWSNPFVLESVDVAAFSFPKNPGELYSVSEIPIQHVDENKDCQQTHQVTWDFESDCEGWSAFYAIDGGTQVTYTSGSWAEPFVLEDESIPAYDFPKNPGELYSISEIPAHNFYENGECQAVHQVGFNTGSSCTGWGAGYSIDGGVPVTYANGDWSEPFVLEDVDVPAYDFPKNPGEIYNISEIPAQHIDETEDCQQTHVVTFQVKNNCEYWAWAIFVDGVNTWSGHGNWTDPFVLEHHDYTATFPLNEGELYDHTSFTGTIEEPAECQQAHEVYTEVGVNCDTPYWYLAIDGVALVDETPGWSNPFQLEQVDYSMDFTPTPGEIYSKYGPFEGTLYEPEECQIAHETDYWSEATCDGYTYGYTLDGEAVETGSGQWQDPYGPESVTVSVVVPIGEGEQGEKYFEFTIEKNADCLECKYTPLYPMATYFDPNAPDSYWQGPFDRGAGVCSVIHPDGQTPSADRVTVVCSLCEEQIEGGYIYHGENKFLDGWVYKVECYGQETHYEYFGYNWDKYVRLGMYDSEGNRTCAREEGCADWIKEQAGILP